MSPANVVVPVPVYVGVPRTKRLPVIVRSLLMEEEAMDTKPPRVERPETASVDEAPMAPWTWKLERTDEEAKEVKPPTREERPEAAKVEEAVRAPVMFREELTEEEANDTKPVFRVTRPATERVEEAAIAPEPLTTRARLPELL